MNADKTVSRARFAQGAEARREEIRNWFCFTSAPPRLCASNLLSAFIREIRGSDSLLIFDSARRPTDGYRWLSVGVQGALL
jgi:hypothetical protein